MTSLQQATGHHHHHHHHRHQHQHPYCAVPPLPSTTTTTTTCRYHEKGATTTNSITLSSSSTSSSTLAGPCYSGCSLNSNTALPEWKTTLHHSSSSLYRGTHAGSNSSLPLHTDPEMYALRNIYTTSENKVYAAAGSQQSYSLYQPHYGSTAAAVMKPSSPPGNSRFAYVEALVDTNAHVIESIWAGTSSNWSRSAVVPLRTFIQEVLKRSRTTYSTLQTALFYLFRARPCIVAQLYGSNRTTTTTAVDTPNPGQWHDAYISCGRRMFLASLVVASKFVQDKTYRNSAWAKIAGLPVAEINAAERIFLDLIDYSLYIAQPTFEQWHHLLHLHVDARAHNQPAYLQDLSYLHASLAQQQQQHKQQEQQQQQQHQHHATSAALPPTPTSPSTSFTRLCSGRKRRLRDTPAARYTTYSSPSTTCSPASPASHIPPVLSLSLPSSSNSSPMHTPTQISPVRNLAFSWKMSPECTPTTNKKRRLGGESDYTSHHGYAVSHVRGMRIKQQRGMTSQRQEA